MPVGVLSLTIRFPGCSSLKEKRSRISPLISRLHKGFNCSVAEMDRQDAWQFTILGCAMIGNDGAALQRDFESIIRFIETRFPEDILIDQRIEMI